MDESVAVLPEHGGEVPVNRSARIVGLLVLTVAIMLAAGQYIQKRQNAPATRVTADAKDQAAPEFDLATFDGKRVKLSELKGKAVLLNFWATWCQPCKVEMPWFADLQTKYGNDGFVVVGVMMDRADDKQVKELLDERGVNYTIALSDETIGDAYGGIEFLPTTFYIGRDGKIVDRHFGLTSYNKIEDHVKKSLATK
jgi:thiol-disulfide isomerase/thioredoxin